MNASPTSWFSDAATVAIGYSATHVDVVGDLDHVGVVAGGDDVGDVDDAGVGLTGGDLGDHAAHVLLEADRRDGDAGGGEDLVGVVAARHLGGADARS